MQPMQQQMHLMDLPVETRERVTRRDQFLDAVGALLPFEEMLRLVQPFYSPGRKGRRPFPMERMLRMYLLRLFYGFTDEGTEDAVCDSLAMQRFLCLDAGAGDLIPDATTLGKFRGILADAGIREQLFALLRGCFERLGEDPLWKKTALELNERLDAELSGSRPHPYI